METLMNYTAQKQCKQCEKPFKGSDSAFVHAYMIDETTPQADTVCAACHKTKQLAEVCFFSTHSTIQGLARAYPSAGTSTIAVSNESEESTSGDESDTADEEYRSSEHTLVAYLTKNPLPTSKAKSIKDISGGDIRQVIGETKIFTKMERLCHVHASHGLIVYAEFGLRLELIMKKFDELNPQQQDEILNEHELKPRGKSSAKKSLSDPELSVLAGITVRISNRNT